MVILSLPDYSCPFCGVSHPLTLFPRLSEAERGAARTAQVSLSKLGNAALLDDALLCADFEQLLLNFPSADQPHASSSPVSESDQQGTASGSGSDAPSNASGANWAAAAEKAAATAPGAAFKAGQAAGEHAQADVAAKIAAKAAAKIGYAQRSVCVSLWFGSVSQDARIQTVATQQFSQVLRQASTRVTSCLGRVSDNA
jgi:hypothetical protein